jgi:hypothetical protein
MVAIDEIEFQPGTWLVRAKTMEVLVRSRAESERAYCSSSARDRERGR